MRRASVASMPRWRRSWFGSGCARSSASRSSVSMRNESRRSSPAPSSRVEPRGVILDVGRAEAILPTSDQSATEHYRIGQHVKAFVLEVRRTTKGPLIYVSRTHKNFLRRLFELEVPEIHAGTVEVKAIAREAGSRSKVAVSSRQEGLDPGRRDGRPAWRPRAGGRRRAGRREDRHHPLARGSGRLRGQRAQPRPGRQRRDRRGEADRGSDRARAHAFAGHRPRGPERASGGEADRLAHRHPLGSGAAPIAPEAAPDADAEQASGAAADPVAAAAEARGRRKKPALQKPRVASKPTKSCRCQESLRLHDSPDPEGDAPAAKKARPPRRPGRKEAAGRQEAPAAKKPSRSQAPATKTAAPTKKPPPSSLLPRLQRVARAKSATAVAEVAWVTAQALDTTSQPQPSRRYPTRTCVACRAERQKRDLVRIVRAPDGSVASI